MKPERKQREGERIPEALSRALNEIERERNLFVPPAVDDVILKAARAQFDSPPVRPGFSLWKQWRLIFAGVTTALMAGLLLFLLVPRKSSLPFVLTRQDINHDGHVDILDALALAKSIKENGPFSKAFDQDGDGKLDEADIKAVAAAAVRLNPKPRS
jgi:hypothetical protein